MNDAHQSGATITLTAKQVQSIFEALLATGNVEYALKVMSMFAPQQQAARIIPPTPAPTTPRHLPEPVRSDQQDVIDALKSSFGFKVNEVKAALSHVDPRLPLEERIRLALQHLGAPLS